MIKTESTRELCRITREMSTRELCSEFISVVKHQSTFAGEPSFAYMAGFLESFISGIADLPKVKSEMRTVIHNHLMELNRQKSRLICK